MDIPLINPELRLNVKHVVAELSAHGAVSLPILEQAACQRLAVAMCGLPYSKPPSVIESYQIKQDLWLGQLPDDPLHVCARLGRELGDLLVSQLYDKSLFSKPLQLNSIGALRYDPGSIGISPHRDPLRFENVTCIVIVQGAGKFFVCQDRDGHNALEIESAVGNLILLRAPGFLESKFRPFHFITEITQRRYSLLFRQERPGADLINSQARY